MTRQMYTTLWNVDDGIVCDAEIIAKQRRRDVGNIAQMVDDGIVKSELRRNGAFDGKRRTVCDHAGTIGCLPARSSERLGEKSNC